jgi:hemolysin activation/secretion protein
VLAVLLAAAGNSALAQSTTDTQELQRQQERERILREQQERTPDVRLPPAATPQSMARLPDGESPCVQIERITLAGDASGQFQWALAHAHNLVDGTPDPARGRCLGTQGISQVMRRIQNALITRGFTLAQVLAGPQQHLTEGTLELTLFPGRIRRIEFTPDTDMRATKWNALPARPGDLLNLRDIEQGLENFKRVPTADADIEFRAAEGPDAAPGQTDVIIKWQQNFPFRLTLSADDSGTRATGRYQGSVTFSYDHALTLNDLFYVSLNHDLGGGGAGTGSYGTRGHTVHYSVPLGYWLLGLTTSSNRYYQSVAGLNQTYLYQGASENSEVSLARVVHRDATRKTTLSLRGWTRRSSNYIDDTEIEVQRRRMAGWGLGIAHREFMGAATLDASLDYRHGTGAWQSLPAPEETFGEGTARPGILTASAQITVPFKLAAQNLRYTGVWRAQWNGTPVIAQDRFSIGGRYTVRGFDGEMQLLAERGWLIRNDLGLALGDSGQEFYLGTDYGEVAGPGSGYLLGKHLSGAVLGLRGGAQGFFYDVFVGRPISKPDGFRTHQGVAGFTLNWSF